VIAHVNDGAHLHQYIRQNTETISIRHLQRNTARQQDVVLLVLFNYTLLLSHMAMSQSGSQQPQYNLAGYVKAAVVEHLHGGQPEACLHQHTDRCQLAGAVQLGYALHCTLQLHQGQAWPHNQMLHH
jgi:hypothetical protein